MSDDAPRIQTLDDYAQAKAHMDAIPAAIQAQAAREGWADDKERIACLTAEAQLPYYTAMSDPANPVAIAAARSDEFSRLQGTGSVVSPTQYPALYESVARQTDRANADNHVDYPPPLIVAVKGLQTLEDSPLQFIGKADMLLVDADYLPDMTESDIRGGGGHEMAHRYQRKPEDLQALLENKAAHALGIQPDAASQQHLRMMELGADSTGADLSSPQMMQNALYNGFIASDAPLYAYVKDQQGLATFDDAVTAYNAMSENDKFSVRLNMNNLPAAEYDSVVNQALHAEQALAPADSVHPPTQDRIDRLSPPTAAETVASRDPSIEEATTASPLPTPNHASRRAPQQAVVRY